jgi:hypothetical protein
MVLIDIKSLDAGFRKASHSVQNGACVEVGMVRETVLIRDSTDQSGPAVGYPARAWQSFVNSTKSGAFNPLSY